MAAIRRDDQEVARFAAQAPRAPASDDANAADLRDERFFARFEWEDGRQRGLIEARRENDDRLVGRYLNLGNPTITRPWVGLIVDEARIDGYWTQGRLDFRR